jgi:hypothetical protein
MELNNRVYELTPDDSREQTRNILRNTFSEDHHEVDFEPIRKLFTWIAGQDNRVVIPYGQALGELIPASAVRMRREAPRLRNLICAHAVLHQASRDRDEQGRIIATLEDYEAVRELVEEFVGASSEQGVKPQVRVTVTKAAELIENSEHNAVTINELAGILKRDRSTVVKRVQAAFPYLVESEERRGRMKQYELGEELPAEGHVLPTKDEVCKCANKLLGEGSEVNSADSGGDDACTLDAQLAHTSLDSRGGEEEEGLTYQEDSEREHDKTVEPPHLAKSLHTCTVQDEGKSDTSSACTDAANCANIQPDLGAKHHTKWAIQTALEILDLSDDDPFQALFNSGLLEEYAFSETDALREAA